MDFFEIFKYLAGAYFIYKVVQYILIKLQDYLGFSTSTSGNPFLIDARLPVKAKVFDQELRDSVLKRDFKETSVPSNLDAIVIGSGIGGLTTAAILSKAGRKVLVLEQNFKAGGCCTTHIEKGYEFDIGIQYVGEMNTQTIHKTIVDQISEGQIEWAELDEKFDAILFKEGDKISKYWIHRGIQNQRNYLKKVFPQEEKAIDRYYKIVMEISDQFKESLYVKFLPMPIIKIMNLLGLTKYLTNFFEWNEKCIQEMAMELTDNQLLRNIFSYGAANFGTIPSRAGFPAQALNMSHFWNGAAYPVGGATEIPYNIIPVIERSGGNVLVNAKVTDILINSEGGAYGVKLSHGTNEYKVYAPLVISDAGVCNTVNRLLPLEIARKSSLYPFAQNVTHAGCAFTVFAGLDATAEELEIAIKRNYWIFLNKDLDESFVSYLGQPKEDCYSVDNPMFYITFSSTKDPTWNDRYPGKTVMTIITAMNYDWYEDWEDTPISNRGEEFNTRKTIFTNRLLDSACELFPKIKGHIDYVHVRTPLENNHYLGSMRGVIYGLDHNKDRFSVLNSALLRPKTDIKGLFLTGQDVNACSLVGALWGGVMCAQQVLNRHVIGDIEKLHNRLTKKRD